MSAVDINSLTSLLRSGGLSESDAKRERGKVGKTLPSASGATSASDAKASTVRAQSSDRVVTTPEYESFVQFARKCDWRLDEKTLATHFKAFGCKLRPIERAANLVMEEATKSYLIESKPVIVTDSQTEWKTRFKWTSDFFATTYGGCEVICNDRAPARAKDRDSKRPQRSVKMLLSDYKKYMECHVADEAKDPPLYLNGWHAFKHFPELLGDIGYPNSLYFAEDHTEMILQEIDRAISGRKQARMDSEWVHNTDVLLNKVFLGPAGNITRLHFDAHNAHGWLAQIKGRKLFILFPPGDSKFLYPLDGEATTQSPIDPLSPDLDSYPLFSNATLFFAVLQEGETLLVPEGWWHYAVSLETSITVMRNFYNVLTNVKGLVGLFANLKNKK